MWNYLLYSPNQGQMVSVKCPSETCMDLEAFTKILKYSRQISTYRNFNAKNYFFDPGICAMVSTT